MKTLKDMLYFVLFIFLFTLTVLLPIKCGIMLADWVLGLQ